MSCDPATIKIIVDGLVTVIIICAIAWVWVKSDS
jgi:hypothetical protein